MGASLLRVDRLDECGVEGRDQDPLLRLDDEPFLPCAHMVALCQSFGIVTVTDPPARRIATRLTMSITLKKDGEAAAPSLRPKCYSFATEPRRGPMRSLPREAHTLARLTLRPRTGKRVNALPQHARAE